MELSDHSHECPSMAMHGKMEEAHHFWHECVSNYQNPALFIINLNACIQALRNVTWALQSDKSSIKDFDDFYDPWEEKMRQDPILQWVKDSRNHIVKQGDLETNSKLRARLVTDYHDAANLVADEYASLQDNEEELDHENDVESFPVFSTDEEIVDTFEKLGMPKSVLDEATISIERRWEAENLPGREITSALSYAFGFLNRLSDALHFHVGLQKYDVIEFHGQKVVMPEMDANEGRFPCMVTTRDIRTKSFSFRDKTEHEGGLYFPTNWDEDTAKRAAKKYGTPPPSQRPSKLTRENYRDFIKDFEESARAILATGEEHGWFILYFRDGNHAGTGTLYARDSADKRALAAEIADHVAVNSLDALVMIGEVWMAPISKKASEVWKKPGERSDRQEALGIDLELATGEMYCLLIPFERKRRIGMKGMQNRVKIGETIVLEAPRHNFFEPTRAVWKAKGISRKEE